MKETPTLKNTYTQGLKDLKKIVHLGQSEIEKYLENLAEGYFFKSAESKMTSESEISSMLQKHVSKLKQKKQCFFKSQTEMDSAYNSILEYEQKTQAERELFFKSHPQVKLFYNALLEQLNILTLGTYGLKNILI